MRIQIVDSLSLPHGGTERLCGTAPIVPDIGDQKIAAPGESEIAKAHTILGIRIGEILYLIRGAENPLILGALACVPCVRLIGT